MGKSRKARLGQIVSVVSVSIALAALTISLLTDRMARRHFYLANRPYVIAESYREFIPAQPGTTDSRGYVNQTAEAEHIYVSNTALRYVCWNTPAEIVSGELKHYISESGKHGKVLETKSLKNVVVVPDENVLVKVESDMSFNDLVNELRDLEDNQELRREMRVEYQWVGKDRANIKYLFHAIWRFKGGGGRGGGWEVTSQTTR